MGDLEEWLAEALRGERQEVERRHKAILAELESRLEGRGKKENGQMEAVLPGQTEEQPGEKEIENEKVAKSQDGTIIDNQDATDIVETKPPEDSDSDGSGGEAVSFQIFKRMVRAGPAQGLRKFVLSTPFELFFGIMIVANTLILTLNVQYKGFDVARELDVDWYDNYADKTWPGARTAFDFFGYFFGVLFTIELVFKILGLRRDFLQDWWNWFDSIIVFCWYIELFQVVNLPIDSSVIRIFRLARLLRLLRLVKKAQGFDSLYLMTTALKGSGSILLWAVMLLGAVQIFVALAINQILHMSYFEDKGYDIKERQVVFKYFGTFSRSLLSAFEMTVGNWVPIARLLVQNVDEWFMILSLAHKMIVGYAMIGIINGVFIQETFKVAATDDLLMIQRKAKASKGHGAKMRKLFGATAGADGNITRKQFKKMVKEPYVSQWLSAMEFDVRDAGAVFSLVDTSGDGEVSLDELGKGISKLKGPARSLDLALLTVKQADIEAKIGQLLPLLQQQQQQQQKQKPSVSLG